jgi:hypothetical protein
MVEDCEIELDSDKAARGDEAFSLPQTHLTPAR